MTPLSFPSIDAPFLSDEGQLSLDIFREDHTLVIRSTVAGVKPDELAISLHGDLLTIRGSRACGAQIPDDQWYYRECYWGAFSRSVVLPYEVASENAKASLRNGILESRVPIKEAGKKINVEWEEDGKEK